MNLVVRNFRFEPDGALAVPDWRREKDGKTEYGPVSSVEGMRVGVHNLLTLGEDILVIWDAASHSIDESERNYGDSARNNCMQRRITGEGA